MRYRLPPDSRPPLPTDVVYNVVYKDQRGFGAPPVTRCVRAAATYRSAKL
jgi:hypothetical protein